MKKISFDGIGQVIATFEAGDVKGGQVVKITGNGQAGACAAGDSFCGVALEGRGGFAGVQVKGFAEVAAAEAVDLGWVKLEADGAGGVQPSESGREYLVVDYDSAAGRAVVYL